ncbi:hypothetical protein [Sphingomonas sp. CARO-RG-8B-R24-01]|uniref:hypothetical protein n=1 Tax=Sphingomonas sp. CARO-RG-8B-R24-01 TaxID=2914831 RepID=UPI001F58A18E|nr:hypothetical protein [Sphingomonas sp. CARO-RG-8B-R24-01]
MIRPKENCRIARVACGARIIALAVLSIGVVASAETTDEAFTGRWRIDTASITGDIKPTVFRVRDGVFRRDDNRAVKADGRLHPVSSDGYVDEQSISIESDHVIKEIDKVRGKLAYTVDYVLSPDGDTLTWHVASYTGPDGQVVRGETVQRRIGSPSKGAHLISGTWKRVGVTADSRQDMILKLHGNRFSSRTDSGSGFDAIIGGDPVKFDGDNSGVRAQITSPRPDLIVETDLSARGTVDDVFSLELMPDQKTIRATGVYGPEKRSTTFYLHKLVE